MASLFSNSEDEAYALTLQLSLLTDSDPMEIGLSSRSHTPRIHATLFSDFVFARTLFEEELKAVQQVSFDHRLAASIRRAVVEDADLIDAEVIENEIFRKDLLLAQRLREDPEAEVPVSIPTPSKRPKLSQFVSLIGTGEGGSKNCSGAGGAASARNGRNQYCDVCTELLPDYELVSLACEHKYCRTCLKKTFLNALKGRDFPPRCCNSIPTTLAAEVLDDDQLEQYFHESVVHDAAMQGEKRRRNCSRIMCGKVLLPGWVREDVGLCMACEQRTCMICGGEAHRGQECPRDVDTIRLFELAEGKRWQRCPMCGSLVELVQGCFHMTCICRHQFCYKCAAKWKSCGCIQADENYITGRAPTTPASITPGFRSTFRTLSSTRQAQLDLEHSQQALRYNEALKRRLEELKTLRRTRESQRDAVMADRIVLEEEEKIRKELWEENRTKMEEQRQLKNREWALTGILRDVVVKASENVSVARSGKGKGKEREGEGVEIMVDGIVKKLVEWTMLMESMPPTPPKQLPKKDASPWMSRSTWPPKPAKPQPKRELSPATRDRMAGFGLPITFLNNLFA